MRPVIKRLLLGRRVTAPYDPATDSTLKLWLDGDVAYTSISPDVQALDTETIRRWPDRSGNGRHCDQSLGTARPAWSASGVNGHGALSFDQADDVLTAVAGLDLFRNVSGATLIAVCKGNSGTVSGTAQTEITVQQGSSGNARAAIDRNPTNTYRIGGRRLDADSFASNMAGTTSANAYIHAGLFDYAAAKAYHYLNNSLIGTADPFQTTGSTSNTDSTGIGIGGTTGGTSLYLGLIACVMAWPRVLSAPERNAVHTYLGQRYGVTVS